MRIFSVSETFGPFPCEMPSCSEQGWRFVLTDEENESLPVHQGPDAVHFILRNKLGTVQCEGCLNE